MRIFGFGKPNIDRLCNKKDVQGLIKSSTVMLENGEREKIIAALKKIGEPAVLPLIDHVNDDQESSIFAVDALGELGDHRAIDPLIKKLYNIQYCTHLQRCIYSLTRLGWRPRNDNELIFYYISEYNFIELEKQGCKSAEILYHFWYNRRWFLNTNYELNYIQLLGRLYTIGLNATNKECMERCLILLMQKLNDYIENFGFSEDGFRVTLNTLLNTMVYDDALQFLYKLRQSIFPKRLTNWDRFYNKYEFMVHVVNFQIDELNEYGRLPDGGFK